MSFAPVLDLNAADCHTQPGRKATRAAGFVLRRLAITNEQLLSALNLVENTAGAGLAAQTRALNVQFSGLLAEVAEATGMPSEEMERSVVEQLRQVAAFANLDGGQLAANVGAVGNLIRSGRVELFAR